MPVANKNSDLFAILFLSGFFESLYGIGWELL